MCKRAHVNWDDLRVILAIVREKTLVRAASSIGVAHTTISRRLKAMESQLGVRLFDRTPDGLVPTAAGAEIAASAQRVEDEVLTVEGRVLGRDAQLTGPLRVSTVDVLFTCFADAFGSFTMRYPGIDLVLDVTRDRVSLSRREADVVLRVSTAPPEALVGRRVGDMQFGVYASSDLVARLGEGAPLSAFPWIGWDGGPNWRWFARWLQDNAPGATIAMRLDDRGILMAHAVRAGIGAQLLPCVLADPDAGLRRIAPLDETFRLGVWLLTLPELRTNRRVRTFLDHMGEALAAGRGALEGYGASDAGEGCAKA
ncbi:MAG: LysR family transcriptional regulator [Myxococcota bacterium]